QIREIIRGDVLSEIDVQTAAGIVTSVITTRSVDELALQVGSEVIAFVKSTEVSIAKLGTRGAPDGAPYPISSSVQKILYGTGATAWEWVVRDNVRRQSCQDPPKPRYCMKRSCFDFSLRSAAGPSVKRLANACRASSYQSHCSLRRYRSTCPSATPRWRCSSRCRTGP